MSVEVSFGLDGSFDEENVSIGEESGTIYDKITELSLVEGMGNLLGLDISEKSSGICIYSNSCKNTYNITLDGSLYKQKYGGVLLRRQLQSKFLKILNQLQIYDFDLIVLEDAFQGMNPFTTRMLYDLNTFIDELILDGKLACKDFERVSNKSWKSWLFKIDSNNEFKGYEDKLRIGKCLALLGVSESGLGYQDRLDATGMVLAYLLNSKSKWGTKKRPKVSFSDVEMVFELESSDVLRKLESFGIEEYMLIDDTNITKVKMLEYLSNNPNIAYITSDYVMLGNLREMYDLNYISEGVFGFCIKKGSRHKYKV